MVFVTLATRTTGNIGIISLVTVNGCFAVVFINSRRVFCGILRSIVVAILFASRLI